MKKDNRVCSNCNTPLDRSDPYWQQHPFGMSYHWDIELQAEANDKWYHKCKPDNPSGRSQGFATDPNK